MSDEEYTVDDIEKMIYELGVLLADPMSGLMIRTLQRNFYEEFKDFTLMEAFDCMVDEVNRVNKVIELHDILAETSREDLERLLGDDDE